MEPTPEDDGDKGEKEMAVDAEGKNEEEKEEESKKGEEKAEDKEEEKATSPKKPRRRTGFDARLAAEAKASGEVVSLGYGFSNLRYFNRRVAYRISRNRNRVVYYATAINRQQEAVKKGLRVDVESKILR